MENIKRQQIEEAIAEIVEAKEKSNFIQSQFAYDTAIEIIKRHITKESENIDG